MSVIYECINASVKYVKISFQINETNEMNTFPKSNLETDYKRSSLKSTEPVL